MKRVLIWVGYHQATKLWLVTVDGVLLCGVPKKDEATRAGAAEGNRLWLKEGRWSEMKIARKRDGKISETRTYPRSSDPRRTPG